MHAIGLLLARLVRATPAVIAKVVFAMVITIPLLALAFAQLFVVAGGDWSWRLFSTILMGGILLGLIFVGAAILTASGISYARVKWVTLIIMVIMAGILSRGVAAIPTAGPLWTTLLWSGFSAVVIGTIFTGLLGTARSVRPLFVIGVLLLCVGALSGIGKWGWEKAHARKASVAIAPPVEYQFCWSKPREVRGYRPDLRKKCLPMQINTWSGGYVNFSVFHLAGGETKEQVYSMNRPEGSGTWKNTDNTGGYGVWEELPTSGGTPVKMLGRIKDQTQKGDGWFTFTITPKSS